jgi:hypothetical protein
MIGVVRLRDSGSQTGTKRDHKSHLALLPSLVCGLLFMLAAVASLSCTTTTTTEPKGQKKEEPAGFWARMTDQITERQCRVTRFSCPYGLGPAGERCECTDPSGRVWQGWTVK